MALPPEPVEMQIKDNEQIVAVSWSDDHESQYRFHYLRGFCPCAACQGHAPGDWTFIANETPKISGVEEVGNYAITIAWSDGHSTGIYSWETLRELCPCESCRAQHGAAHAMTKYPAA